MKDLGYYQGREQTYLKHFFLERYLERVAYIIGSWQPEFTYVDGFSGPWKSESEAFEDTSFIIAINRLRQVRDGLIRAGKRPRIRCLFIEKDTQAFRSLERSVSDISDLEAKPLKGEFEELIPDIMRFIGNSFSLVFIDPSGWTGFGLRRIKPIIQRRPGEVIVNFMFDYINRFLEDPRPEIAASFDDLFGGRGWETALQATRRREENIVELYRERMRTLGTFKHVTSTRILKPTVDRAYYYLVYGTRHVRGLLEFRQVEKQTVEEQERVRFSAKQTDRIERTRQEELFSSAALSTGPTSFKEERAAQLTTAASRLRVMLRSKPRIKYEDTLGVLLEMPLVWESDVQQIIKDMRAAGELEIENLAPRERTVKAGHVLISKTRA